MLNFFGFSMVMASGLTAVLVALCIIAVRSGDRDRTSFWSVFTGDYKRLTAIVSIQWATHCMYFSLDPAFIALLGANPFTLAPGIFAYLVLFVFFTLVAVVAVLGRNSEIKAGGINLPGKSTDVVKRAADVLEYNQKFLEWLLTKKEQVLPIASQTVEILLEYAVKDCFEYMGESVDVSVGTAEEFNELPLADINKLKNHPNQHVSKKRENRLYVGTTSLFGPRVICILYDFDSLDDQTIANMVQIVTQTAIDEKRLYTSYTGGTSHANSQTGRNAGQGVRAVEEHSRRTR